MAQPAVARGTLFALRQQIAKIEGVLPERLESASVGIKASGGLVVRDGLAAAVGKEPSSAKIAGRLATGAIGLDKALGGGLPTGALTEIHGEAMRDAGAVVGFTLALIGLVAKRARAPILWIGTKDVFREAGFPYAPGLQALSGIEPRQMLVSQTDRIEEALWIAEEAARLRPLGAVLLEVRGHSARLDLTATRRLHHRAQEAGRPVILLRHSAQAEPTAAPVRLIVAAAPTAPRRTFSGPLAGSIGPPAFTVSINKNRTAPLGTFVLEWNGNDRGFEERAFQSHGSRYSPRDHGPQDHGPQDHGVVVPPSRRAAHPAAASGSILALESRAASPARDQPPREQHAADRRAG